jgi:hypothetical protein
MFIKKSIFLVMIMVGGLGIHKDEGFNRLRIWQKFTKVLVPNLLICQHVHYFIPAIDND